MQTMINKEMPAVANINPVEQRERGPQSVAYTSVSLTH